MGLKAGISGEYAAETDADAVVVGGGIAGLSAANRLAQLGRRAVVLEQGQDERYMCNSRLTGGAIHICYRDPMAGEPALRDAIEQATVGTANPALVDAVARDAGRAVNWLREEGMGFARGGAEEYKRWVLTPLRPARPGLEWEGRGGDVMLRRLETNLTARGGQVVRGARVSAIEPDGNGGWIVCTQENAVVRARAVIIADGGFQGDAELVGQHISPKPERVLQRGAGTGRGDGLRMALALGAASVGLDRFYGHVMVAEALENPNLWPYPWADPIATAGIVVDGSARRFVDEAKGAVFVANAIAKLDDPLSAVAVCDETIWRGPAARGVIPPNPNLEAGGATVYQAATIAELAVQVGLSPEALAATVAEWNEAVAAGNGAALAPARGEGPPSAFPVINPPFRAVRLCAGITYTMGGIAIDGDARVVRADGSAIDGLYAAGTAAGGLEGGPKSGYVGGLAKSCITGLRAAEHIAQRAGV